ncbi:IclR family transcriptional regulator [Humibacter ginsenosidimutans]|uniref:IclR family transcriptional regulator n=1 Tax=Humibacter ginsenosidimutans TaxID=2599293 RepID=A0A5B8M1G9_9MICO|nr:IclR family transcriptional regulator [Humibacter ginsenosidimutans]QDZ14658.1 IclR family transcriptional regulator [Humibacter ginsenosidimutans]
MTNSVKRAADILDSIAAEPKTVAQLAGEFELHRSTMFRELQSLEEVGFARRRHDGTYSPGFRLAVLGASALERIDLREAAHPTVLRLQREIGDTVHLAALVGEEIVYVDKVEDSGGVRMYSRVGSPVRPQCSALGKVILSGLDETRRDDLLAGVTWAPYTSRSITSRAMLDAELDAVARRGWAADDGEFEEIVNCIAVPITTPAGVVGALSVTSLRVVHDLDQLATRIPLLTRSAAVIARELG